MLHCAAFNRPSRIVTHLQLTSHCSSGVSTRGFQVDQISATAISHCNSHKFPALTDFSNPQGTECNIVTNWFTIISTNLIHRNNASSNHARADTTVFVYQSQPSLCFGFPSCLIVFLTSRAEFEMSGRCEKVMMWFQTVRWKMHVQINNEYIHEHSIK
jgi:hypothetical protein